MVQQSITNALQVCVGRHAASQEGENTIGYATVKRPLSLMRYLIKMKFALLPMPVASANLHDKDVNVGVYNIDIYGRNVKSLMETVLMKLMLA